MSEKRVVRRLAAILAADVVGYSRLMGRDEEGTLARLKAHRTERFEPIIAKRGGRLVKLTGDGALVEFGSAVDALNAAIEIQQAIAEANGAQPEDTRIVFRIGLHLGDLIVDGDDLYGDGVNVAARLEGKAPPGGIVLSGNLHDAVVGRLEASFEDLGAASLKNIERPVRVYRVLQERGGATAPPPPSVTTPALLALPDKPSIAILPFQNMSGDPEQEYFADGIVEDIITALSRFQSLFVIARNSSFTYKGTSPDVRQVGWDLGVRYVLEGSVRKMGSKVRITGQLIDSQTGAHLWADRFEGALADVFELQDRVAAEVAGRLPIAIEQAEIERARRKSTVSLGAYDGFLLGMRSLHRSTRASVDAALVHFLRAIELDPEFAEPHSWAAIAYTRRKQGQWMADVVRECTEGVRIARRAAELRPNDSLTVGTAGFALAFLIGEVATGLELIDRSLALNPNDSLAWHGSGWVRCYNGDHDLAIEHIGHAERLGPLDPQWSQFQLAKGMAHYCAGRYDVAAALTQTVLRRHPDLVAAYVHFARSAAMAGRLHEGRAAMTQALLLHPNLRLNTSSFFPLMQRPQDRQRLREGARLAGMPE